MPTVKQFLEKAGDKKLDAEVILAHVFKKDRSFLASHPEESVPGIAVSLFERRKKGEPLAYVLNEKEFYGRKFYVDKNVLIPRPETETVVDFVLERIEKSTLDDGQFVMIVDVGTGSGAIANTVALEAKRPVHIIGLDNSEKALGVAEKNSDRLNTLVKYEESDLLEIFGESIYHNGELILVANLPYVDKNWDWLSPELEHEPSNALYAGSGGLKVIFDFLDEVSEKVDEGYIILEADPCQHEKIRAYAEKLGFQFIKSKDFALEFEV